MRNLHKDGQGHMRQSVSTFRARHVFRFFPFAASCVSCIS